LPQAFGGGNTGGSIDVSTALTAHGRRIDFEVETFVANTLLAKQNDSHAADLETYVPHGLREVTSDAGGDAPVAIQERAVSENPNAGADGAGVRQDGAAYTLEARTVPQSVATDWAVRRLTPRECERLQGFPDDFTQIPWRGKEPDGCPDGPRYKALGNSMAVNVMQWIGERIAMVEASFLEGVQ
jgi:DNA (cytosine-5)-methyltransferase 1